MPWYIWIICIYFTFTILSGAYALIKRESEWDLKATLLDVLTKLLGVLLAFQYWYHFVPASGEYTLIAFYILVALSVLMVAFETKYVFFPSASEEKERIVELGKEMAEGIEYAKTKSDDVITAVTYGFGRVSEKDESEQLGNKIGFVIMIIEVSVLVCFGWLAAGI